MSDNYITICTDKEADNPKELSFKLITWLQENDIIEKELSNCVLGMQKLGYKPGERHIEAIGFDENLLRLQVCGMEVKIGREVFNAMAFTGLTEIICPKCGKNRFEGITPAAFFGNQMSQEQQKTYQLVFEVFDSWSEGEEPMLSCPFCKANFNLVDYKIGKTMCLSNLGFTFWNWPQLRPEFIDQVKAVLGCEVKVIYGHI